MRQCAQIQRSGVAGKRGCWIPNPAATAETGGILRHTEVRKRRRKGRPIRADEQIKVRRARPGRCLVDAELNVLKADGAHAKLPIVADCPIIRAQRMLGAIAERSGKTRQAAGMNAGCAPAAYVWREPGDGSAG